MLLVVCCGACCLSICVIYFVLLVFNYLRSRPSNRNECGCCFIVIITCESTHAKVTGVCGLQFVCSLYAVCVVCVCMGSVVLMNTLLSHNSVHHTDIH